MSAPPVIEIASPTLHPAETAPAPVRRKRRRLTRKRLALLAAGVVVVGFAVYKVLHRGPAATAVQTAKVAREDLQAKIRANGKIQAQRKVDISATVPGQVTHLAVREGDRVRKGDFLLQIDPASPRAAARGNEASMQALSRAAARGLAGSICRRKSPLQIGRASCRERVYGTV